MADTKISALAAYSTQHGDDLFAVVDVHDTSMGAGGTNKYATTYQAFGSPSATGQIVYWNGTSTGVPAGAANLTVGASGQLNLASVAAPGSPVNGDSWHDSTQHAIAYRQGGLTLFRTGLAYAQIANVTVTASGSSSLVSTTGASGTVSLPAGFLNVLGRTLRVRAGGYCTTASSSAGTVAWFLKLGSNVFASTVSATLVNSTTAGLWTLDLMVTTTATGASGTLYSTGATLHKTTSNNVLSLVMGNATGAASTTTSAVVLDLTAAYVLDLQLNLSATGNSFTLTNLIAEVLG